MDDLRRVRGENVVEIISGLLLPVARPADHSDLFLLSRSCDNWQSVSFEFLL